MSSSNNNDNHEDQAASSPRLGSPFEQDSEDTNVTPQKIPHDDGMKDAANKSSPTSVVDSGVEWLDGSAAVATGAEATAAKKNSADASAGDDNGDGSVGVMATIGMPKDDSTSAEAKEATSLKHGGNTKSAPKPQVKPRQPTTTTTSSSLDDMEQNLELWNAKRAAAPPKNAALVARRTATRNVGNENDNNDNADNNNDKAATAKAPKPPVRRMSNEEAVVKIRQKQNGDNNNNNNDQTMLATARPRYSGAKGQPKLPPHLPGGMAVQVGRIVTTSTKSNNASGPQKQGDDLTEHERRVKAKMAESQTAGAKPAPKKISSSLVDKERRMQAKVAENDRAKAPPPPKKASFESRERRVQAKTAEYDGAASAAAPKKAPFDESHERRLHAKIAENNQAKTPPAMAKSFADDERRVRAKIAGTHQPEEQSQRQTPTRAMAKTLVDEERRIHAKIAGDEGADNRALPPSTGAHGVFVGDGGGADDRTLARPNRATTSMSLMPASIEHVEWGQTSTDHSEDDGMVAEDIQAINFAANVAVTPGLAASFTTMAPQESAEMEVEDLEADEGIEMQPGAYAVRGVGNNDDSESVLDYNEDGDEDPVFEDVEDPESTVFGEARVSMTTLRPRTSGGSSGEGTPTAPFNDEEYQGDGIDPNEAFQAVLVDDRELDLVEDAAVVEDEEELDLKHQRRMRIVQVAIVCLSLVGIVCVVVSGVNGFTNSTARGPATIQGWKLVASQAFPPNTEEATLSEFGSGVALSRDGQKVITTAPGSDSGQAMVLTVGDTIAGPDRNVTTVWNVIQTLSGLDAGQGPKASLTIDDSANTVAVGYPFHQDIVGGVQVFEQGPSGYSSPTLLRPFENNTTHGDNNGTSVSGFGYALDFSSDGTLLAVGAPLFETEPNAINGFVRVYARMQAANIVEGSLSSPSSSWVPLGDDLMGLNTDEMFGWSVAICGANRVAVGAPFHDTDTGLVRVFEFDAQTQEWQQLGDDIVGEAALNRFGESVALSDGGDVLVASARGSGFELGFVKTFRFDGQEWVQDSHVFTGRKFGDGYGAAVALTGDATRLAIGAPYDSDFGLDAGIVQVWTDVDKAGKWVKEGSDIGGTVGSNLGASVDVTVLPDTDVVRVVGGAPSADFDEFIIKAGSFFVYDRQLE